MCIGIVMRLISTNYNGYFRFFLFNSTFLSVYKNSKRFFIYYKSKFGINAGDRLYIKKRRRCRKYLIKYNTKLLSNWSRLPLLCMHIYLLDSVAYLVYYSSNNFFLTSKFFFNKEGLLFSYALNAFYLFFNNFYFSELRVYLPWVTLNSFISLLFDPFKKSIFSSSIGSNSLLLSFNSYLKYYLIQLPSGKKRLFPAVSSARMEPKSSNSAGLDAQNTALPRSAYKLKNAGTSHYLGFKPTVRGVAKNPVDHPHGGRTKSIKFPRTPWGLATKRK